MNDIKIDENMKRALDLFASFDFELQGITLKNINDLSTGNNYATYHNNYVQKLSDEDKYLFISKISEIYASSLKDEKSVELFHNEINKMWNTEDKKSFLDALINIDKNDFPENIKNTRNLLLTKYSPVMIQFKHLLIQSAGMLMDFLLPIFFDSELNPAEGIG